MNNDTVCEIMAYIASMNGMESMAYSYLELIKWVENDEEKGISHDTIQ